MKRRNILISAFILLGVMVICICMIGGMILLVSRTYPIQANESSPGIPLWDIVLPESPENNTIPGGVQSQMEDIERQVIQIRGLSPEIGVEKKLLTTTELRENVLNDFFSDYSREDAADDVLVLSYFGFIEPDYDLYQLYIDLYSEQVAGYYDSTTAEMFLIQGIGFHGVERMTYSHEFTHVLQDQLYDIDGGLNINEETCEVDTEYCLAVSALLEGDATFTEEVWFFRYSTEQDKIDVQDFYQIYASPVYDSAPLFLQQDFLFPYQQGLEFVYSLYDRGGWEAIDAAYLDPPLTTEQILHPDSYPDDKPSTVELLELGDVLGDGWRELDSNVMGEWYIYLMLAYGRDPAFQLPVYQARQAAAGWEGDSYSVFLHEDGGQFVILLHTTWETEQDTDEFLRSMVDYGRYRWGSPTSQDDDHVTWTQTVDGEVTLYQVKQNVIWLIAPDEEIESEILEKITID